MGFARRKEQPMVVVPRPVEGRVPPHDLDAEAAVLSACLLDPGALDVVLGILKPEHFYSEANQRVFEACRALAWDEKRVDVVSVASWLRDRKLIEAVGGAGYLGQLTDAAPAVAYVDQYAQLVLDKWRVRAVIGTCQYFAASGYWDDIGDVGQWIGDVEQQIFAVTQQGHRRQLKAVRELVDEYWQKLNDPSEAPHEDRIDTGLDDYDEYSGGMYRGELIMVAGRPGMGKSALAFRMGRNIAGQGMHVPVFSLEMPEQDVRNRLLAQESAVSLTKIRDEGRRDPFQPSEQRKLGEAVIALADLPLFVDDTPAITVVELRSKCRKAAAEAAAAGTRLGAVIVDYLQLMKLGRGDARSREREVSDMSAALKTLARELHVPVIACAQLSRAPEARTNKRPTLADLRESGSLEQDADQVIFVFREAYYSKKADSKKAELIIAKNRNSGETGVVDVGWWGWCTRFCNERDA